METGDGLFFAVVSPLVDDGCYLTSLRYHREEGRLRKLDTEPAAALVHGRHPGWRRHSPLLDAVVHMVPDSAVVRVHRPEARLENLRQREEGGEVLDAASTRAVRAARELQARGVPPGRLGVSGSLLLGAAGHGSDIDLVSYGRDAFWHARRALAAATAEGTLAPLAEADWRAAWDRRGRPVPFAEYQWHEERKGTKALVEGTRMDLSLIADEAEALPLPRGVVKQGRATIAAVVTGAIAAFDHPARYQVAGAVVDEVLSFTPTYAGQAQVGEVIEASGWLEEDEVGVCRLVVGSSREAGGEWIRVKRP